MVWAHAGIENVAGGDIITFGSPTAGGRFLMRRRLGILAGALIAIIGVTGLVSPDIFRRAVGAMQMPPALYVAAAIRFTVGVALVAAAPASRAPWPLRILGAAIAIGGMLTPFWGEAMARTVLSSWDAMGPGMVRLWSAAGAILGAFIIWTLTSMTTRSRTLGNEQL
jgi:hypothetical protein